MYRYVGAGNKGDSPSQRRNNRIRTAVMLLLLIALIGVIVYSASAVFYRNEAQNMMISRIQSECSSALTLTNSLSRTAGTNSSATLGKIRGHVYTMETLSDMYLALNNRALVPDSVLDALYALIDEYSNKLITGMTTGDMQSSLLAQIQSLQMLLGGIK